MPLPAIQIAVLSVELVEHLQGASNQPALRVNGQLYHGHDPLPGDRSRRPVNLYQDPDVAVCSDGNLFELVRFFYSWKRFRPRLAVRPPGRARALSSA